MTLIKEKPVEIAKALEQELGVRVVAAHDGMKWVL
jgi:hypothetical protein